MSIKIKLLRSVYIMTKKPFETTQSNLLKYNGQDFKVLRQLDETEADISDVGNMFEIQFNDGFITDAFEDEIYK
jgi:hypothetical protein